MAAQREFLDRFKRSSDAELQWLQQLFHFVRVHLSPDLSATVHPAPSALELSLDLVRILQQSSASRLLPVSYRLVSVSELVSLQRLPCVSCLSWSTNQHRAWVHEAEQIPELRPLPRVKLLLIGRLYRGQDPELKLRDTTGQISVESQVPLWSVGQEQAVFLPRWNYIPHDAPGRGLLELVDAPLPLCPAPSAERAGLGEALSVVQAATFLLQHQAKTRGRGSTEHGLRGGRVSVRGVVSAVCSLLDIGGTRFFIFSLAQSSTDVHLVIKDSSCRLWWSRAVRVGMSVHVTQLRVCTLRSWSGSSILSATDQSGLTVIQTGQSQPSTVQTGQSQPGTVQTGQSQPDTVQTDQSQSAMVQTDQSQLSTVQTGQSQPDTVQTDQSQPAMVQTDQSQPSTVQTGQSHPGTVQTGQSQPDTVQTDQSQPAMVQTDQSQPSTVQTGQSHPGTVQTGQSQPGTVQTGRSQPGTAQTGQSTPTMVQTDQSQPGGVQTDQSQPGVQQTDQQQVYFEEAETMDQSEADDERENQSESRRCSVINFQGTVTQVLSRGAGLYVIDGKVGLCLANQPLPTRDIRTGDVLQVHNVHLLLRPSADHSPIMLCCCLRSSVTVTAFSPGYHRDQGAEPCPGDQRAEPWPGDQRAEPCPGDQRAEPCPGDKRAEPCPGDKRMEPCPGDKRVEPCPGDKRMEPCPGDKRAEPCHGDRREEPCPGDKRAEPCPGDKRMEPCPGDKRAEPCPGDKRMQPCPGDKRMEPCPGDKRMEPCPGDKRMEPCPGDKRMEPCPGDKRAEPCPGDKRMEPCPGDKRIEPCPGDKRAEPCPGDKRAEPCPGDKRMEPCPGDKRAEPCPGDKRMEPCPGDKRMEPCPGDKRMEPCPGDKRMEPCPGDGVLPRFLLEKNVGVAEYLWMCHVTCRLRESLSSRGQCVCRLSWGVLQSLRPRRSALRDIYAEMLSSPHRCPLVEDHFSRPPCGADALPEVTSLRALKSRLLSLCWSNLRLSSLLPPDGQSLTCSQLNAALSWSRLHLESQRPDPGEDRGLGPDQDQTETKNHNPGRRPLLVVGLLELPAEGSEAQTLHLRDSTGTLPCVVTESRLHRDQDLDQDQTAVFNTAWISCLVGVTRFSMVTERFLQSEFPSFRHLEQETFIHGKDQRIYLQFSLDHVIVLSPSVSMAIQQRKGVGPGVGKEEEAQSGAESEQKRPRLHMGGARDCISVVMRVEQKEGVAQRNVGAGCELAFVLKATLIGPVISWRQDPKNQPITDREVTPGEKKSLSLLFCGAPCCWFPVLQPAFLYRLVVLDTQDVNVLIGCTVAERRGVELRIDATLQMRPNWRIHTVSRPPGVAPGSCDLSSLSDVITNRSDLVSFQGFVVDRMGTANRSQGSTPSGRSGARVRLTVSDLSGRSLQVYMDLSHTPFTPGLLPGNTLIFSHFQRRVSRSGGVYCSSVPISCVYVNAIGQSSAPDPPPLPMMLLGQWSPGGGISTARVKGHLVCILFLQLQWSCSQCQRVFTRVCSSPLCTSSSSVFQARAKAVLEDGSAEAHVSFYDPLVQALMRLDDTQWAGLQRILRVKGHIQVQPRGRGISVDSGSDLDSLQSLLLSFCSEALIGSVSLTVRLQRPRSEATELHRIVRGDRDFMTRMPRSLQLTCVHLERH